MEACFYLFTHLQTPHTQRDAISDAKVLLHSINSNTFAASSLEYGTTLGKDQVTHVGTRPTGNNHTGDCCNTATVLLVKKGFSNFVMSQTLKHDDPLTRDPHTER